MAQVVFGPREDHSMEPQYNLRRRGKARNVRTKEVKDGNVMRDSSSCVMFEV